MRIEYDRDACHGWFQCIQHWDAFEMNPVEGVAELDGAEESENGTLVREVPEGLEENAVAAADVCPVDAIVIHDDE